MEIMFFPSFCYLFFYFGAIFSSYFNITRDVGYIQDRFTYDFSEAMSLDKHMIV